MGPYRLLPSLFTQAIRAREVSVFEEIVRLIHSHLKILARASRRDIEP